MDLWSELIEKICLKRMICSQIEPLFSHSFTFRILSRSFDLFLNPVICYAYFRCGRVCHSCIYLHMWLSGYECFNRLSWGEWRMISSLMQVKGRCAAHYNSCSAVPVFPRVPAHRTCSLTSWNRSRNFHHFNLEFSNTLQ